MSDKKKINVGVVGVGYLGSYHVEQYQQLKNIDFVGCHDVNPKKLDDIKKKYKVKTFKKLDGSTPSSIISLNFSIDFLLSPLITF